MHKLVGFLYKIKFTLLFGVISAVLVAIYTKDFVNGHFLFMGDQFIRFNWHEAYVNSFFLRKLENLGVFNAWQLMVQLWDVLFYLLVYGLGANIQTAERILFFVFFTIQMNVSFYGFRKVRDIFSVKSDDWVVFIATLFFCFNPYTIVLWHGGLSFLGLAITYSLAPWILYFIHRSLFVTGSVKDILITSVIMYLSSFVFWLYAVVVFFMVVYSAVYVLVRKPKLLPLIKRIGILVASYLLLCTPIIYTITLEYFNNKGDMNGQFAGMFSMQKGGLWYQILMYFSWGIYNIWTPRSLYPFSEYFYSLKYIISTLSVYVLALGPAIYLFIKKKYRFVTAIIVLILLLSLFFAKGSQPPLGSIFVFMYNHVPFFNVFRSPDHRFGFAVVWCISLLLIISGSLIPKKILLPLVLLVIVGQSSILLTGVALTGKNVPDKFVDRLVIIPEDYTQLASYINHDDGNFGYVLTIPQTEYGYYKLGNNEAHIGQDMLSKIVEKPFIYLSPSLGISRRSAVEIYAYVSQYAYEYLAKFPIKYVLIRKDVICTSDCLSADETKLSVVATKVLENDSFSLYRMNNYADLIQGEGVTYQIINPDRYKVTITNTKAGIPTLVNFGLSDNSGWILVPPSQEIKNTNLDLTYSNLWQVMPQGNKMEFEIYYNPNSVFALTLIISTLYLVFIVLYVKAGKKVLIK